MDTYVWRAIVVAVAIVRPIRIVPRPVADARAVIVTMVATIVPTMVPMTMVPIMATTVVSAPSHLVDLRCRFNRGSWWRDRRG
jgi:hypothetical protein